MSYEARMNEELKMPPRKAVEEALLRSLFRHQGVVKEFGVGEEIVDEIADDLGLNEQQRAAYLETVYRKENRVKRSSLWHRLLFRVADSLAKGKLILRPTQTLQLTDNREWMLTEKGFDEAIRLMDIPASKKDVLPTKFFEVQRIVKKMNEVPRPITYNPIDLGKERVKVTREIRLRTRAFRQAVIEAYDCRCAVCGMKICAPDFSSWEIEAAHIVPHTAMGRDDIWNGIALCRLHHWAFDVGWFSLSDNYRIVVSSRINDLPAGFGLMNDYDLLKTLSGRKSSVHLPCESRAYPHQTSVRWHRENILYR